MADVIRPIEAAEPFGTDLLDQVEMAVIVTDPGGAILQWNRRAETMYGWTRDEMVGSNLVAAMTTEAEVAFALIVLEQVRAGKPWEGELDLVRKDGGPVTVFATISPIHGPSREVTGLVGVSMDITARKLAERRAAAQHAVTMILSESTTLGQAIPRILEAVSRGLHWELGAIWLVDEPGGVLRCSDVWTHPDHARAEFEAATRASEFPLGRGLPGRVWQSGTPLWIADVTADTNFPRFEVAAAQGLHGACAFPIVVGSDVLGVTEFFSPEIRQPDEDLLRMMASVGSQLGQFLERKQAEGALRDREATTTAILRSAMDAVISIDAEGRVFEFNPAAERMFGYRRDEAVGRELAGLIIPPGLRDQHRRGLRRYRELGQAAILGRRVEMTGQRADGSEFPVELAVTPVETAGQVLFTAYVRDITDRKALEDERARLLWNEQEARAQAEEVQRQLEFLAEANEVLTGSLDFEDTLARVARLAVPTLADWCGVDLFEDDGTIRPIAVAHVDPAKADLARALRERYPVDPDAPAGVPNVRRTGQPELYAEIPDAMLEQGARDEEHLRAIRELHITSLMIVPMVARGRTLGAITLVSAESGVHYDHADLALASDLARRAALAVDNARLYGEVRTAAMESEESRSLLDTLLSNAPTGLGFLDTDLRFVRINDALARMNGVPAEVHIGRTISDIMPEMAPTLVPVIREVLETGKPVIDLDVTGSTSAAPDDVRHWLSSYYPVPGANEELIGVGVVVNDVTERARVEDELNARARQQAAVAHLGQLALTEVELSTLLEQSVRVVGQTLQVEFCAVLELAPDQGSVVLRSGIGWRQDGVGSLALPADPGSQAGFTLTAPDPVLVSDYRDAEGFPLPAPLEEHGIRSGVTAAIRARSGPFGVLGAYTRRPNTFSKDDVHFLEAVANVLAAAIERRQAERDRAELLERERSFRSQAERSAEMIRRVQSVADTGLMRLSLSELLEVILRRITEALHADAARILLTSPDGHHLTVRAAHVLGAKAQDEAPVPIGTGIAGRVAAERRPIIVNDLAQEELASSILRRAGVVSLLGVPLVVEDELIGVASVGSVTPRTFTDEDLLLLQLVGDRIALAIRQARLYEAERRARADAERVALRIATLQEVTASLSRALTPGEVADILVERGVAALQASAGIIALLNEDGTTLQIVRSAGYEPELVREWAEWSVDAPVPLSDAVRSGEPVLLQSVAERVERYPHLQARADVPDHATACIPISLEGRKLGGMVLQFSEPRSFLVEDRNLMMALARQCAQSLERARLFEAELAARAQAEAAQRRLAFLATASDVLTASLGYEGTLAQVAQVAIPELADWSAVDLVRDDGDLARVAAAHSDPAKARQVFEVEAARRVRSPFGASEVVRTGRPQILTEVSDEVLSSMAGNAARAEAIRSLGLSACMIVPLRAHDRILGAVTFASTDPGRVYGTDELSLAEELARRAAMAIENARLFDERTYVAQTLQRSLLPPKLPEIPRIELAARYRPAGAGSEVGGDFYDVFDTGDGAWAVVIGDVCGKGPDAAAMTGLARYTIRASAMQERRPSRILRALNDAVLQQNPEPSFCTVAYARIRPGQGSARLTLCCAGHPLPLVLRADGTVERIGIPGTLLGFFPDPDLNDQSVDLGPGDTAVLYTDGVTEQRGEGRIFGVEGLEAVLASCAGKTAEEVADAVERAVVEFVPTDPRDDLAIMILQVPQ